MREILHLRPGDARRIPWKNGRGLTDELALWPPDASFERADFDWRISKASVSEPGAFSTFPGFDRILVVTDGEGLVLAHAGSASRARLRRLEPYRFSGDASTTAELVRGSVLDFNVLVRRGNADALVQVLRLGRRSFREALAPEHEFVHVLAGELLARVSGEDEPLVLERGDSVWARDIGEGEELELAGRDEACVVLLVRIATGREASERTRG